MTEKDLKYQELKRAYDKLLVENKKLKINNQMLKEENQRFRVSNGMLEEELQEYQEFEEQGLLLKLPCKVGDKVYQVLEQIRTFEVTTIGIYDNRIVICTENWETGIGYSFDAKQIGKRYFLTKEEAEAKLKELQNERN